MITQDFLVMFLPLLLFVVLSGLRAGASWHTQSPFTTTSRGSASEFDCDDYYQLKWPVKRVAIIGAGPRQVLCLDIFRFVYWRGSVEWYPTANSPVRVSKLKYSSAMTWQVMVIWLRASGIVLMSSTYRRKLALHRIRSPYGSADSQCWCNCWRLCAIATAKWSGSSLLRNLFGRKWTQL